MLFLAERKETTCRTCTGLGHSAALNQGRASTQEKLLRACLGVGSKAIKKGELGAVLGESKARTAKMAAKLQAGESQCPGGFDLVVVPDPCKPLLAQARAAWA